MIKHSSLAEERGGNPAGFGEYPVSWLEEMLYWRLMLWRQIFHAFFVQTSFERSKSSIEVSRGYGRDIWDCTSSGHYALEIEAPEMKSEENEVMVNNLSAEYSEKVKQMVKIHKQFAHPVRAIFWGRRRRRRKQIPI